MERLRKQNSGFVKKFAALILVLALGAVANAELTFTISGPSSLNFGQTGTYIIGYSGLEILSADIDIVADVGVQPYGINNGVILASCDSPWWSDPWDPSPWPGWPGNYQLAAMNDITPRDLGSPLFAFDFTAPSTGTIGQVVTISMIENSFLDLNWDTVYDVIMPSIQVTLTPEPTTLMLLGFGGLFLRRRK